jgi:hypothetical protein
MALGPALPKTERSIALQHLSNYKMALFPTEKDREVNLVECSDGRRFSDPAWLPYRKSSKNTEILFQKRPKKISVETLQNIKI